MSLGYLRRGGSLLLALLSFASLAWGGGFKVLPLRLTLDPARPNAALRLINTGDRPVTVQLEARVWRQGRGGEDHYLPTDELMFFPRLVEISVDETVVVRVAYRGEPSSGERAFRLYAQEIPMPGEGRLQLALRLGIPVFIRARGAESHWEVDEVRLNDGEVEVVVVNQGRAHALLRQVRVVSSEGWQGEVGGWYLFPGVRRAFSIPFPERLCRVGGSLRVTVEDVSGRREDRVTETGGCSAARSLSSDSG